MLLCSSLLLLVKLEKCKIMSNIQLPTIGDITNKGLLRAIIIPTNYAICWDADLKIIECEYSELRVVENNEELKRLYSYKINVAINRCVKGLQVKNTLLYKIRKLFKP